MNWRSAANYARSGGVSLAQSFLKHSLVPTSLLCERLPADGLVLDLGCGEGILTNSLADRRPDCRFLGIDRDQSRLAIATRNAAPNATFQVGDIFELELEDEADAAILNDVAHHHGYSSQGLLLRKAMSCLRPGGLLILKEVDICDRLDHRMTEFFDRRLYPADKLSFRTLADWQSLLRRLGVTMIDSAWFRHPWPASRTIIFANCPDALRRPEDAAATIGDANMRAREEGKIVVFLTGATGFIGGHLARRLLAEGFDGKPVRLVVLCRDPARKSDDLAGATPLFGDLDEMPNLRAALRDVDYVFHLAAEVKLKGGRDVWRNNYHGTVKLLEACKEAIGLKRFVHASTVGAVDRGPSDPCVQPLTEEMPAHPLSEYGRTKLMAEEAVQASGLPYSILRVPWAYGSGMTPDTHVWFLTEGVAKRKLFSRFHFPGRVSVITAADLVDAFLLVASHKDAINESYFASDGQAIALGDLFRQYASVAGLRVRRLGIPRLATFFARRLRPALPLAVQCLNSDVLWASPDKLFDLGFRPRLTQRQGLALLAEAQGRRQTVSVGKNGSRLIVSLVTGAAGGIGKAVAHCLAGEGHRLLLIDRNEEVLALQAESLNAEYLAMDLTDPDAAERIEAFLDERGYLLDWVVNNAGIGARGASDVIDPSVLRAVEALNCSALRALSGLAIRHFKQAGTGTLVNIGSSAGFQPMPYMAVYGASKSYVQSFTLALAGEVAGEKGISVVLVNPSGVDTGFQAAANVRKNPGERLHSADEVAAVVVDSGERGSLCKTIGLRGRLMALLGRVVPLGLQVRLWAQLMDKLR
jgi:nucleoside-diphosphate-sugar epimerase